MSGTRSIWLSAGFFVLFCFSENCKEEVPAKLSDLICRERNAKALNQIFCNLNPGHSDRNHQSWLNMLQMAGFPQGVEPHVTKETGGKVHGIQAFCS